MLVKFYTFDPGHLVSDKEFDRLKKGFAKADMELVRKDDKHKPDIVMVKGFSHSWEEVKHEECPIVLYNIGTEYKKGIDLFEANQPLRDLYYYSHATVSVSEFCRDITERVFGGEHPDNHRFVIIPACEPKLPVKYAEFKDKLKLATTCIPRPVKRLEEMKKLCEKFKIELVTAEGNVDDFSYYHDCHGYIHLSRKEGMPNTVLEAMSYGLPCIVTNYGGAKEAVGDAGIVIKNDPVDIPFDLDNIEPIDEWLFINSIIEFKSRLQELRMQTRRRVLSELNDKICAEKFNHLFKILCEQQKKLPKEPGKSTTKEPKETK